MRAIDQSAIRNLTLFREMADDTYDRLMRGGYVQNFPPQIDVIIQGDPCDFLHIVVEGSVELFADWNGRESTMAVLFPISSFILAAAIKDAQNLMSARTIEKSKLLLLPATDVRREFDADTAFARAVVAELADSYRGVVRATKNLKLRNSTERLANYFVRQQVKHGGDDEFTLVTEKRRLASMLGMTAENLSRALEALRNHGIEVDGNNVTITDKDALRELAKPTPLIDEPIN